MFILSGQARRVGEGRRSCCGGSNAHGRESIRTKELSRAKLSSTLREHRVSCQRG